MDERDAPLNAAWRDTWPGVLRKTLSRWSSSDHWTARQRVARGMEVPALPRVRGVWAISMVKNEADVIESSIRHLLRQGIDHVLIVDNMSNDGTYELLSSLTSELPVTVGIDREAGYFQSHKMSALAAAARRAGADWVIPFDADEYWFATRSSVSDFLMRAEATRVEAWMYNVFPTRRTPVIRNLEGVLRVDLSPHLLTKVAARPHPLLWIGMGNHTALRPGASMDGLRILHVPWRSRDQLLRKVRQGAAAYRASSIDGLGGHWIRQDANGDEEISQTWEHLLDATAESGLGWYPNGPHTEAELCHWDAWDPQGIIEALPPQPPTF